MKRLCFLFFLLILLGTPVCAATGPEDADGVLWSPGNPEEAASSVFDSDGWRNQLEASGATELPNALPEDARSFLEGTGLDTFDVKAFLTLTPQEFFQRIKTMIADRIHLPFKVFGALVGAVILCAMLESLRTSMEDTTLTGVFSAISVVCVAAVITPPIVDCITRTANAIQECATFIAAFIPVFASVVTVAGQPATAGVYTGLLFMACQMVSHVVAETLVPLMGIYLAFCIAGNLAPGVNITAIAKAIRQAVTWCLGLFVTLFVSLLSIQSLVASGGDQVLSKTAKFILGSFVPVVGSALGDALAATQGYLRLLKTSVGAFGILAALLTFLPVFLQTVLWYITVSAAGAVGEMLNIKQAAEILKSTSATLGVLMAVILCFALLVIVSTSLVLLISGG